MNYISVENLRKGIEEYKLCDESGGKNTYKQLEAFVKSITLFYPTMLMEIHKEFIDYTMSINSGSIKTLGEGYKYKDININSEDLLIPNKIIV